MTNHVQVQNCPNLLQPSKLLPSPTERCLSRQIICNRSNVPFVTDCTQLLCNYSVSSCLCRRGVTSSTTLASVKRIDKIIFSQCLTSTSTAKLKNVWKLCSVKVSYSQSYFSSMPLSPFVIVIGALKVKKTYAIPENQTIPTLDKSLPHQIQFFCPLERVVIKYVIDVSVRIIKNRAETRASELVE